ncbi:MAG: transposase [Thermodesulfobacteriota bacterium]
MYKGNISAAFTLCSKRDVRNLSAGFSLRQPEIVNIFTHILASVATKERCIVPVYCFMDDHQHLIISGTGNDADIWKTVVNYKQKTGFWMSENKPGMKWQKDFYDHIIRTKGDMVTQVRYILDNPVRKCLVSFWDENPFKGSIGCNLEDFLQYKQTQAEACGYPLKLKNAG